MVKAQSIYQSAFWRYYNFARKEGLCRSHARRKASKMAKDWYSTMKRYAL